MTGTTYDNPGGTITYYRCPHNPATPKHAATCPDHPRTVQAPETLLDQIIGQFFADRIFGPGRAALLAAQLPATDADALAERDARVTALQARVNRIETAQNSQILELEQLPADPADTAAAAMRARIRARFADLHHEREQLETQLAALAKITPAVTDPALLDELPLLGDILPDLPAALKARLLAAFGIEILWNKPGQQVTVFAQITENTLQAIPGITDPSQDGYHDTSTGDTDPGQPAPMWDLTNTHRLGRAPHPLNSGLRPKGPVWGQMSRLHASTQAARGSPGRDHRTPAPVRSRCRPRTGAFSSASMACTIWRTRSAATSELTLTSAAGPSRSITCCIVSRAAASVA